MRAMRRYISLKGLHRYLIASPWKGCCVPQEPWPEAAAERQHRHLAICFGP